ncbi:hypothetical protein [Natronorubrum aibiense]|uniref:hypothetical protein n=1 Tax=Natronorubrum aibiense TaxID=348826 RepID=UPI001D04CDE3|nr:hypothetical protein [Natronorubrum aibiense]
MDTSGDGIRGAVDRGSDSIIVDTLGLGNVPEDMATAVKDAIKMGVTVAVTTRCRNGIVSDVYGSAVSGSL